MRRRNFDFRKNAAIGVFCVMGVSLLAASPEVRRQAESGDAAARLSLARDFMYGLNGEKRNPTAGFFWLKKAADSGNPEALYNLGFCYEYAHGTDRDIFAAYRCYEQAAALKLPEAEFRLALLLRNGVPPAVGEGVYRRGITAAPERAKKILNDLTRKEFPPALLILAEGLLASAASDNANAESAVRLLRKAAGKGDVRAMKLLADCLHRGLGTKQDLEAMAFYLGEAAKRGDMESLAALGLAYEYGIGVRPEPEKAFQLTRRAAENGVPSALLRMADYAFSGVYSATDPQYAVKLLEQAAAKGEMRALFRLGNCYASGVGVERNDRKAFEFYLQAATLGEPNAQYALALAYKEGVGTPADPSAVRYWLKKASAQGNSAAADLLKTLP